MSQETIRISAIQCSLGSSAYENFALLEKYIHHAAEKKCQLIVLPELHQGPYPCQIENPDFFKQAETIPGSTTEKFSVLAKKTNLVIITSIFEKRMEGVYHNTAVVFDTDGSIAGCYRKMHIPDDPDYYEKFYFTPGDNDGFKPIQTSLGSLGVLVCWDQWFPEAARLMALAGAEILIYPTAIGWDQEDDRDEKMRQLNAWEIVQRGHTVANHLPLICCNRIGLESHPFKKTSIQFWGHSFICGAQGEILTKKNDEYEGLLIAQWDKSRQHLLRCTWPFFRDRRIDSYAPLLNRSNQNAKQ